MATEDMKHVTVFIAGLGQIDIRTRMPQDAIIKEMRGEGDECNPVEAIFVGVDEVDNIVHIHLTRHNILGYVIRPFVKQMVERIVPAGQIMRSH